MKDEMTFAIVGAGLAGAKAAETLRMEGFDGRVVLIGTEPERPYERPPLSKDYLRGEAPREKAYVHDEAFYADNEIELMTDRRVIGVDDAAHTLLLDGDETVSYSRALLATGSTPRRLTVPGADLAGVHYLRTLSDADALRTALEAADRIVVVGAGWIGSEVAASARQLGLDVTVVEPASVPLERVLGREVGQIYRDVHADHGVRFVSGTGVERLEGSGSVSAVRTADGQVLDADAVVVGIGAVPAVDGGIPVGPDLRTSSPDVFAAGDVANADHPFYGRRIRVEHWANALNQGAAAARSMLGHAVQYDRLPYFYSDQYDIGTEYTGYATDWDEVVFRGDTAAREFISFWLKDGCVIAGMNVNVWDVTDPIKDLIRSRVPVDRERLADPDVPLASLVATPRAA